MGKGAEGEECSLDGPSFWNTIIFCLKTSSPLVRLLRLVDGEKKAPTRYIYEAMTRAKEIIVKSFLVMKRSTRRYSKSLIGGGRFSFISLCMQLGTS